jgi:hypothetical protein
MDDARMYEEIMEVSSEICDEREIDFLESISVDVENDTLSPKQKAWLRRIWEKACGSPY